MNTNYINVRVLNGFCHFVIAPSFTSHGQRPNMGNPHYWVIKWLEYQMEKGHTHAIYQNSLLCVLTKLSAKCQRQITTIDSVCFRKSVCVFGNRRTKNTTEVRRYFHYIHIINITYAHFCTIFSLFPIIRMSGDARMS